MANSFRCSDCGGDGTRCRCHEKRTYSPIITQTYAHLHELDEKSKTKNRVVDKNGKILVTQKEWDEEAERFVEDRSSTTSSLANSMAMTLRHMKQFKVKKSKK